MCCLSWLSALFGQLGWHSSNAAQPLSQELQNRTFTSAYHGYRTLESMPQLPAASVKRGGISSIKAFEPKPSSRPLSSKHSIGVRTLGSMAQLPTIGVKPDSTSFFEAPASTFQAPSLSSEYAESTAQIFESMPQVPAATVKRDSISAVKESATMPSTPSLSKKYPNITVRSIEYQWPRIKPAEIAYSIGQRKSWHWLPYRKVVDEWGMDVIEKFNPSWR